MTGAALALLALTGASLQEDFPSAAVERGPGGAVVHASGLKAPAPAPGASAEDAARAFLERYAADLGIGGEQQVRIAEALPGRRAVVQRVIDGLPVFQGDLVLGLDGGNAVILVNGGAVPPRAGKFKLGATAAGKAALKALGKGARVPGQPTLTKGWYPAGTSTRPAWRVDLVAQRPPGDWRLFVDAESGAVLFRHDRRVMGGLR